MKTITYPLRLSEELFEKVQREAQLQQKELSEVLTDAINCGLPSLPPPSDSTVEVVADTWDRLGPAPEIDYDKL